MFTSLDAARGASKRLKAATDGMGRPQKLTRCQAVVVTACGFNRWQHLAKTLGNSHEPGGARDKDRAFHHFSETMRPLLPRAFKIVGGDHAAAVVVLWSSLAGLKPG